MRAEFIDDRSPLSGLRGRIVQRALDARTGDPASRLLLVQIAARPWLELYEARAFVPLQEAARLCEATPQGVMRALQRLERGGWVQILDASDPGARAQAEAWPDRAPFVPLRLEWVRDEHADWINEQSILRAAQASRRQETGR